MKDFCQALKSSLSRWRSIHGLRMRLRQSSLGLQIVVGSAGIYDQGWIPTDIDTLNILKESHWKRIAKYGNISAILAEHVWEHLAISDGERAALNCYRYLKPGGYLRLAVPDGFHPDREYVESVKVGGSGCGADGHKVLYNYKSLKKLLLEVGFQVQLLEYFDENGNFHYVTWSPAQGKIHRSAFFDARNEHGELKYTSLIVDAIKPSRVD